MAVAGRVFVSLDCADAMPLAEFWAAMLGGEIMFATATGTVGVRTDGVWLLAMEIPGYSPPTWPEADIPKQIHLDLAVGDLETAVVESERLGATLAAVQPDPDRWRVLFDPAGHPFCLTTVTPPE
ncbi:VOC family protein [Frankia sp. Mgl5]|uniref:VOC family protein n=1 Tax=Frankia sp. Mgl5 TaxID=2933793 RepID=UPI0025520DCF|nr:VOC family protein [Frankia sp. Mgl5]